MKLFEKPYSEKMKKALKPSGILCSLGKIIEQHLDKYYVCL